MSQRNVPLPALCCLLLACAGFSSAMGYGDSLPAAPGRRLLRSQPHTLQQEMIQTADGEGGDVRDWVVECEEGRLRCPSTFLASWGYQCATWDGKACCKKPDGTACKTLEHWADAEAPSRWRGRDAAAGSPAPSKGAAAAAVAASAASDAPEASSGTSSTDATTIADASSEGDGASAAGEAQQEQGSGAAKKKKKQGKGSARQSYNDAKWGQAAGQQEEEQGGDAQEQTADSGATDGQSGDDTGASDGSDGADGSSSGSDGSSDGGNEGGKGDKRKGRKGKGGKGKKAGAGDDGSDEGSKGKKGKGKKGGPWQSATSTWYSSYPACCHDSSADSSECDDYSGCKWEGMFKGLDGKQSKSWVQKNNLVAVFEAPNDRNREEWDRKWKNKRLRLKNPDTGKTLEVRVVDTCDDSDCSGCCTENASKSGGMLVDLEANTAARFWGKGRVRDMGRIQFQVLEDD